VNRLLVAIPLYLTVPAIWFCRWEECDKRNVVGVMATRKLYLAASMNNMVGGALERDDWDRMVVLEADMIPPVDAFTRIANYPDTLDIVGSMYFQHPPPHHPVAYTQADEDHYRNLHRSQIEPMMDNPGLYPVDGVGMGFTSIHRRVLETWDENTLMFGGEAELGHDLWFCRAAKRQGFTVHVDSGIECAHLTEIGIGYQHSKLSGCNAQSTNAPTPPTVKAGAAPTTNGGGATATPSPETPSNALPV